MIVAVAGGKGGVGKSTVALNLGSELEATVVDADLTAPDLPGGTGPTLHDVLAERATASEAVEEVGSVRVVPSGRTLAGSRAARLSGVSAVVDDLERKYGRVVVDCGAGLARDVGVGIHRADVAVLVTAAERTAVLDALRTNRLAEDVHTPVASVAVNRFPPSGDERFVERLSAELAAPVTTVPECEDVQVANAIGRPVRDVRPDSTAVDALAELANSVRRCERRRRGPDGGP